MELSMDTVYALSIIIGLVWIMVKFGREDRAKREQESANKAAGFLSMLYWWKK